MFMYLLYMLSCKQYMCPPGYHHSVFVASHALGHMMYCSHLASVRSGHCVSWIIYDPL